MRYQNVSEVKTAVESIASAPHAPPKLSMPVKTPPIQPPRFQPGMSLGAKLVIAFSCFAFVALVALVLLFFVGQTRTKQIAPSATTSATAKSYWDLLNDDQRAVIKHTENKFHSVLERRDFAGWSPQRLAELENASLQKIKNPPPPTSNPNDYFRAINTLAALRSVKALPALLKIVSAHTDKLVWTDKANRDRCMATRALGMIGNKGAVPQLIPLLYHPNISTRWWAQIALVQLTGQNLGGDWNAWANWWNAQNLPPPIGPDLVRWWSDQETNPTKLMAMMTQLNREFFDGVGGTS